MYCLISFLQEHYKVDILLLILLMMKLRSKEVKSLARDCTAFQARTWLWTVSVSRLLRGLGTASQPASWRSLRTSLPRRSEGLPCVLSGQQRTPRRVPWICLSGACSESLQPKECRLQNVSDTLQVSHALCPPGYRRGRLSTCTSH